MPQQSKTFAMGRFEFIALVAMMSASIAFSIDAMLPALPFIGAELSPDDIGQASLILTSFVFGMGVGTFITGPLADAYGRKPVIYCGVAIYVIAAIVAWASSSIEMMLIARVFQGLGAAGPRIAALAIIRDRYEGREMAKIVSFVMMVFTLVPAIAPLVGSVIIEGFGWRGIFIAFVLFSLLTALWVGYRLPETLAPENKRPLRFPVIWLAVKEVVRHPVVRLSILVQSLAMAMLFSMLMLVQPIYYEIYDRAESFPYWFGAVAIIAGSASLLNALLVGRYGMRRLVTVTLFIQLVLSFFMCVLNPGAWPEPYGFAAFVLFQTALFFQAGLTLGNLNAMAMEPLGHIAGTAASVISAISTVLAATIASPVGLLFNGTILPLVIAMMLMAGIAFAIMLYLGKMERQLAASE